MGWRRAVGNTRSFVGNALGGLRGGPNLASWAVAGTLAYFLWVKPARELKKEQEVPQKFLKFKLYGVEKKTGQKGYIKKGTLISSKERAALAAASDRYRYVEKRKPIPDPQGTGLIYGKKNETKKSEDGPAENS